MDLMTEKDVVKLTESSRTIPEWNDNCDKVKAANNNDYPSFWFRAILLSGVAKRFDTSIKVTSR